jgi:hypothetical protein
LRRALGLLRARHVLRARLLDVLHRQGHLVHPHRLLLRRGRNLRRRPRRCLDITGQRPDRFAASLESYTPASTALLPCSVAITAALVAFWLSPRIART